MGTYELLPWPVGRVYVPRKCHHNEIASVIGRLNLSMPLKEDSAEVLRLTGIAQEMVETLTAVMEPWTIQRYLDERRGRVSEARVRMLESAGESLLDFPITELDAKISVFVKKEMLLKPSIPRVIMPTSDRYLVELGRYISALEEGISQSKWFAGRTTKGMTYAEMGAIFNKLVKELADPVCYCIDFSKYDAHVSVELMKIEHDIYLKMLPDDHLRYLLSLQLNMRGRSAFALFSRTGGRASGCPNTTIGNTIINILVHEDLSRQYTNKSVRYLCMGDDAIVLAERFVSIWPSNAYEAYGLKGKMEQKEIELAEYCSGHFMKTESGYTFVRELNRMLRKLPKTVKQLGTDEYPKMAHAKLHADLCLMPSYPIVSVLLKHWHDKHKCKDNLNMEYLSWTRRHVNYAAKVPEVSIDPVSRNWFYVVYGLSPKEQTNIESVIMTKGWHTWLTEMTEDKTTA